VKQNAIVSLQQNRHSLIRVIVANTPQAL